ncbi:unnamed protein product [Boreogadus saida]
MELPDARPDEGPSETRPRREHLYLEFPSRRRYDFRDYLRERVYTCTKFWVSCQCIRKGKDRPFHGTPEVPGGRSEERAGDRGGGQRDRKWKLWAECGRVFSRPARKGTTPTPAGARGVNGLLEKPQSWRWAGDGAISRRRVTPARGNEKEDNGRRAHLVPRPCHRGNNEDAGLITACIRLRWVLSDLPQPVNINPEVPAIVTADDIPQIRKQLLSRWRYGQDLGEAADQRVLQQVA